MFISVTDFIDQENKMNGTWSGGKIVVKHCDEKRISIIQESFKMKRFIVLEYKLCLTKMKPLQIFHSQGQRECECECECKGEGEAERNKQRENEKGQDLVSF